MSALDELNVEGALGFDEHNNAHAVVMPEGGVQAVLPAALLVDENPYDAGLAIIAANTELRSAWITVTPWAARLENSA
jgi:hypothetical protein